MLRLHRHILRTRRQLPECFVSSARPTTRIIRPSSLHPRRNFSTATPPSSSSSNAASSSTLVIPPSIGQLRSRRVVQIQRHKQKSSSNNNSKSNSSSQSNKTKKEDEKPWPKSMIYAAWTAGATLVPYTVAWMCVGIPRLRDAIWNPCSSTSSSNSQPPLFLRRHFGVPDLESVASVDVWDEDNGVLVNSSIPYRLPGEGTAHEQAMHRCIEQSLAAGETIRIRLRPILEQQQQQQQQQHQPYWTTMMETTADAYQDEDEGEIVVLPASLAATTRKLMDHLSTNNKKSSSSSSGRISVVAVDFPSGQDADDKKMDQASATAGTSSSSSGSGEDETSISFNDEAAMPSSVAASSMTTSINKKDPLLGVVHTYSAWYYQHPLQHLDQGDSSSSSSSSNTHNHVTASLTNDEMRIRTLQDDISRLEAELRNLTAPRPYDDIQDELERTKATLRRIQGGWKRWVPW